MGLMKRSYFGGLRVKPSPTKQTFVTILFHAFFCLFPVLITLSTSVSPWARTLGRGTSHLPCKRHYTFEFTNPWHLHPSLSEFYNKMNKWSATWQPLSRRLPMSWHLQPSLSSSVWSCWREPLRGTVLLCPRGMLALLLLGSYHHSSAWSSSVHAFLCCKDTSQSCMDICQGLFYWQPFLKTSPVWGNLLTSFSSGSSLRVSVCGTIWPSNQSTSWLCENAHEPHGSPSSFSSHGGQGDSHASYDVTQCARSGAAKEKANMHSMLIMKYNKCIGSVRLATSTGSFCSAQSIRGNFNFLIFLKSMWTHLSWELLFGKKCQ